MRAQAREILQRGATDAVFEQYLTDKGFTEAWLTELTQQAIDVLEGRVRDQLLRLRRAVEEARARGAALPAVPLARVRHTPTRAKDAPPTPESPAPAPR